MAAPAQGLPEGTQASLLDPSAILPTPGAAASPPEFAASAAILIDSPLPHLDHPFDYGIPPALMEDARPGVRVKVRFAGMDRDGYVLSVGQRTPHTTQPLRRVVSPLPVMTEEVLHLARSVAARYAGTLADVLRLAIPPRHARTEKGVLAGPPSPPDLAVPPDPASSPDPAVPPAGEADASDLLALAVAGERSRGAERARADWSPYGGGEAFIRHLLAGRAPRAAWGALPWVGRDERAGHWARAVAAAAWASCASGRNALIVAPTAADVAQLAAALGEWDLHPVTLTADAGPAERYRAFLQALLGRARVVIGTRSAAFAPLPHLGLVVCWDDGHDALREPRAPYPHAREVLVTRAHEAGAAVLVGGYGRTVEAQDLVRRGWAQELSADRTTLRSSTARGVAPDDFDLGREGPAGRARFPRPAWELARRALERGPVLIQVPRAGYIPVVSCAQCRTPARCTDCGGPLAQPGSGPIRCRWCDRPAAAWRCPACESEQVRAQRVGSHRTAEELGRAFPGVPVVVSGRASGTVASIAEHPQLVVATPGAEPPAAGGYRAAVCLDAAVLTNRPELDAGVEALRRWLRVAALTRADGTVMVLGDGAPAVVQAFVRWDPAGFAARELAERIELEFPPATRMIALTGAASDLRSFRRHFRPPDGASVLGPVPVEAAPGQASDAGETLLDAREPEVRLLVRIERGRGSELSAAVLQAQAVRSARREGRPIHVQVDPDVV